MSDLLSSEVEAKLNPHCRPFLTRVLGEISTHVYFYKAPGNTIARVDLVHNRPKILPLAHLRFYPKTIAMLEKYHKANMMYIVRSCNWPNISEIYTYTMNWCRCDVFSKSIKEITTDNNILPEFIAYKAILECDKLRDTFEAEFKEVQGQFEEEYNKELQEKELLKQKKYEEALEYMKKFLDSL
jgi:hypothetical protein